MSKSTTSPPPMGPGPHPPRALGFHGRNLWDRVQSEYAITDCAGIELLFQACAATDRCEALAVQIEADGAVIATKSGLRSHPAIKDELQLRGFITRTLVRLGITTEPTGPMGRPSGSFNISRRGGN